MANNTIEQIRRDIMRDCAFVDDGCGPQADNTMARVRTEIMRECVELASREADLRFASGDVEQGDVA